MKMEIVKMNSIIVEKLHKLHYKPRINGKFRFDQNGFTLIELVMAIGVTGILLASITAAVGQVFNTNTRNSEHMVAVRQVQNAGYWVSRDSQMARSITDTAHATSPKILIMDWVEWDGTAINVTYSLSGTTPNLKLNRLYKENNVVISNTVVGQSISSSSDCHSIYTAGSLVFTMTATVGNENETRIYSVRPKPGT
jgi:prepilin-type N-terminal cleavage/methylation domain-containing protein